MSEGNGSRDPAKTERAKKVIEKMKEQAKKAIARALKEKREKEQG